MARRRTVVIEYAYVVALAGVAVLGFASTGYLPTPSSPTDLFATALPAAGLPLPGEAPGTVSAASLAYPPRTVELYQTVDFAAPVPPSQLVGAASSFDVEAVATFTNEATGDTFVTEAFYDGGFDGVAMFRFRFTPTSLGRWTLSTASDVAALSGIGGVVDVVPAADPDRYGFLTSAFGRFAAPVAGTQELTGIAYQVFMHGGSPLEDLGTLPTDDEGLRRALTGLLDEAQGYGFPAVFVGVWHQWFGLGTSRSDRHDSVEPDPATFRVLETLCALAHDRGMFVHIWQWGDEQRRWSPLGIAADAAVPGDAGGVNGAADRRLQRYIAARLGPLPNWTLGYGFDLYEWADEDQVRAWSSYLLAHSARPHLLTAIEQRRSASRQFDLGETRLGLVSDGAAAEAALAAAASGATAAGSDSPPVAPDLGVVLYDLAHQALASAGGRPVLFENRFLYRGDLWTMDGTRRGLWGATLAGGAAAVWGIDWDRQEGYPDPEQLLTYREFWRGRLDGELISSVERDGSFSLLAPDGSRGAVYVSDSAVVSIPPLPLGASVWAVDTVAPFRRVSVPIPDPNGGGSAGFTWQAPHVSDWALAIDPPGAR